MIVREATLVSKDGTGVTLPGVGQFKLLSGTPSVLLLYSSLQIALGDDTAQVPLAVVPLDGSYMVLFGNETAATSQVHAESGLIQTSHNRLMDGLTLTDSDSD